MTRSRARTLRKALAFGSIAVIVAGVAGISYLHRERIQPQIAKAPIAEPVPLQPAPLPDRLQPSEPQPPPKIHRRVALGTQLGKIEVPRLHLQAVVREGIDDRELSIGAGHVPSTPMPGDSGNVAIAAHRDRHFFPLRNIQPNDEIVVNTTGGTFKYVVKGTEIVTPDNVSVLRSTPDAELTLITCYPFFFRGHAPKRFIVHAVAEPDLTASR